MELWNKKEDGFDVVGEGFLWGENLHLFPKVLVPLAGDVIRNNQEHEGSCKQSFKKNIVRIEVSSKNKQLKR
jgi:hypothetical protein